MLDLNKRRRTGPYGSWFPLKEGDIDQNWDDIEAAISAGLASRADLTGVRIPSGIDSLRTSGYSSPGDGGGALYKRVESEPSHAGKLQTQDGAWWEISFDGPVNAAAFGLDMTGAAYSDTAFKNCLDYVRDKRTSPTGLSGWGQNVIELPKGILKLSASWVAGISIIGMTIRGKGKYATSIEFYNDTDPLFDLGIDIALTLEDLSLIHVPQNADRSTWTNSVVKRTGSGGGNELLFNRVHTKNWAIIDNNTGTTNNDTSRFTHCRLIDPRCVVHARSSQAVINKFDQTTIFGKVEKILDVAGYGHTLFDSCNIVVDGIWLFLANASGLWGRNSVYTFRNTKGEPLNSGGLSGGSASQIVVVESASAFVAADVILEETGFSSAVTLDPLVPQIDVTPNVRVHWNGGHLDANATIKTTALTVGSQSAMLGLFGIVFENMRSVPTPAKVTRTSGAAGSGHAPITWRNNLGVPNMTMAGNIPSAVEKRHINRLTRNAAGNLVDTTANFDLPFYGQRQRIVEVLLHLDAKAGNDLTVDVYSDAARSSLIGTITLTSGDNSANPLVRRLSAAVDAFVTEGLYFTVTATTSHIGYIQVTHEAA